MCWGLHLGGLVQQRRWVTLGDSLSERSWGRQRSWWGSHGGPLSQGPRSAPGFVWTRASPEGGVGRSGRLASLPIAVAALSADALGAEHTDLASKGAARRPGEALQTADGWRDELGFQGGSAAVLSERTRRKQEVGQEQRGLGKGSLLSVASGGLWGLSGPSPPTPGGFGLPHPATPDCCLRPFAEIPAYLCPCGHLGSSHVPQKREQRPSVEEGLGHAPHLCSARATTFSGWSPGEARRASWKRGEGSWAEVHTMNLSGVGSIVGPCCPHSGPAEGLSCASAGSSGALPFFCSHAMPRLALRVCLERVLPFSATGWGPRDLGGPARIPSDRLSLTPRAAGTAGARPARRAVAAMRPATAAPSASTRTGRSTTTCAARACKAPRPPLTQGQDSPTPPAWAPACPRPPPPAPARRAPRGPPAPGPLGRPARWTPRPADPPGPVPGPRPPPSPGSRPTVGVTAATASLQEKTEPTKLHQRNFLSSQLPEITQRPLLASQKPPTKL